MTKMIIEVPTPLHRLIKLVASSKGESMKNLVIRAVEHLVKNEANIDINQISEEKADEMLKPYLMNLVNKIEHNKEKLYSWEEAKKELKKTKK